MSIKQKTLQGIFWSGIQNWGSQAGSFIIFLILARLLTPEDWGLVALANIFINFMQIFLEQGFAEVLIQKETLENKQINTVFWTQLIIALFVTLIIFSTANFIAQSFQQPTLTPILQSLSILFVIAALSRTQIALLKRKFNFKALAIRSLLGIIIAGIVGIFLAFSGFGVWSLVGQQITYETVAVIVLWEMSNWRPQIEFSWQDLQGLFSFSINILGFNLVDFFNQYVDSLLIGYFLGEVALGYYAIAHRILQVMTQLLIKTLSQVALSAFSRLQNDSQRFLDAFYRATQLTSLIAFPVFFATIVLSPELVIILFGEKWLNTIPIMQILGFTGILRAVSFFQNSAFVAIGKPAIQFKLGLLNALFNLIACMIAVQWGILAVAVAYVLSDYLVFPITQWFLSQLIAISWKNYLSYLFAPVVCTFVMVLIMYMTQQGLTPNFNPQARLIICSTSGIISYSLTLAVIYPSLFQQMWTMVTTLGSSPQK